MRLMRLSVALLTAALAASAAHAGNGQVINAVRPCCPPFLKHCFEGPPKIKFKPGCPKPICDPCNLEHFGYYSTCWAPWPYAPDWSHCRVQPFASVVPPHPGRPPVVDPTTTLPNLERTPAPRINEGGDVAPIDRD